MKRSNTPHHSHPAAWGAGRTQALLPSLNPPPAQPGTAVNRLVVLDTETTGLEVRNGHRVIEIGCIELVQGARTGRTFHTYLNPHRSISPQATKIHGKTDADVAHAPSFREVGAEFLKFVRGATLVAHHAPFDVGFIDAELCAAGSQRSLSEFIAGVIDTLALARRLHPHRAHDLRSLCRFHGIPVDQTRPHGALTDAALLASLYCAMCPEQVGLGLTLRAAEGPTPVQLALASGPLTVRQPTPEEAAAHEHFLDLIDAHCPAGSLWRRLPTLR